MAPARQDHSAITIVVDGSCIEANSGMTVAAVLMHAGIPCRRSVRGEPRAPLCGMGICFECAATVDGAPLRRTCQVMCRAGMEVVTE
ncbi:MAG: (2Fe-2S)-binding protein [Terracidiphilus sp.]